MGREPRKYGCCSVFVLIGFVGFVAFLVTSRNPSPHGPDVQAPQPDTTRGVPQDLRGEIYRAYYHAGMDASAAADARFPFAGIPTDQDQAKAYLADRHALYEQEKDRGGRAILARYQIDRAQLDAIEGEGVAGKWPLDPRP